MQEKQALHVGAHGGGVDLAAHPGALKGPRTGVEVPRVGADYDGAQEAGGTFFADVVGEDVGAEGEACAVEGTVGELFAEPGDGLADVPCCSCVTDVC